MSLKAFNNNKQETKGKYRNCEMDIKEKRKSIKK